MDSIALMFLSAFSSWIVNLLILFVVLYGYAKKVPVYEAFVEGAKEGFTTAVMIIPYLVAIFMAIAIFRVSGALDFIGAAVGSVISTDIMPTEVFIMSLMKPMSGSGARGLMVDVFSTYGVDSYAGYLASAIQGSTETTFYVIAVYFGAIGVRNSRYTIGVGLTAELIAIVTAVIVSLAFYKAIT